MNITQERAVNLFVALGHKTAKKWKLTRLQSKIDSIPEELEGGNIELDRLEGENDKTMRLILKAHNKGKQLTVVEDEPESTESDELPDEDKPPKKNKKKKEPKEKKKKKETKEKKEKKETKEKK